MTQRSGTERGFFLDLPARAKLRVTGADRFRFLNGQITNDLRKASEAVAVEACVLNAKGKLNAHIFIAALGESLLIDAEDIWSDPAHHDALRNELTSAYLFIDSAAADVMRIEQGLPRWGRELTDEIIPIEANLEQRTIDYEKGCYIGQEVISRIKMSGQTNKRLCGLISLNNMPLQLGTKLVAPSASGKEAGWITSATRSQRLGKEIALGYVKRGFNNPATNLDALSLDPVGAIPVEVVSLPFP